MTVIIDGTSGVTTPGVVNTAAQTIATTLAVTGVTTIAAGSAAAPALVGATGGATTGVWFPAASTVAFANAGVESARIDPSGNLLVGCTVTPFGSAPGIALIKEATTGKLQIGVNTTSSTDVSLFYNPNGIVGKINLSGSTTAYVTSSDYRLKEAIVPMTGALAKVALLKPVTYKWKVDGSDGQGFIAHELAEVEAGCVTGEKDAVDADGNPQYQGIDTSFLIATLSAAIQELHALVKTQDNSITALNERLTALEATA